MSSNGADSKAVRAIKALPFLAISATAIHFMWGIALPPLLSRVGEIMKSGVASQIGPPGLVQPLHSFWNIEFIDSRIRGLAACFASFQFIDTICNWQSFTFLVDAGVVYAIVLIESARQANYMTFVYFPLLLGYNMQFFGIGVLMALYCFAHYIQSSIESLRTSNSQLTDVRYTASVLPVLILCHYIPNYACYSDYLEPQTRHIWNWIWQPFPIYISVLQVLLKNTIMPTSWHKTQTSNVRHDLLAMKLTIWPLCALSAATWLFVLYSTPYSWPTIFIPSLAADQSGDEYIRMFLQFDEIFSMGACFLWLLYLYGDMKKVGMMDESWLGVLTKGIIALVVLGPGAAVGLGWLYREQLLAAGASKNVVVPGKMH